MSDHAHTTTSNPSTSVPVKEITIKTVVEQLIKFLGGRIGDILEEATGAFVGHHLYDTFRKDPAQAQKVIKLMEEGKYEEAEKLTRTAFKGLSFKDEQKMGAALLRAVRNGVEVSGGQVTMTHRSNFLQWFRSQEESLRVFIKGYYDEYTDNDALAYDLAEVAMMADAERLNFFVGLHTRSAAERLKDEVTTLGAAAATSNAAQRTAISTKWTRLTGAGTPPPPPTTGSFAWLRNFVRMPAGCRNLF